MINLANIRRFLSLSFSQMGGSKAGIGVLGLVGLGFFWTSGGMFGTEPMLQLGMYAASPIFAPSPATHSFFGIYYRTDDNCSATWVFVRIAPRNSGRLSHTFSLYQHRHLYCNACRLNCDAIVHPHFHPFQDGGYVAWIEEAFGHSIGVQNTYWFD